MNWPRSLPDYRWPERSIPAWRRWFLAAVFYTTYAFGLIFSPLRSRRNILFLRTDGLGDGVLSEPMIRAVAARYPAARIHLWAPAATRELFSAAEYVHYRQTIPRGFKPGCVEYLSSFRWRKKMGWNLGRYRFDIAIYPAISPEPLGNWIFASSRADKHWIVKGDLFHQFEAQQEATLQTASRIFPKPRPAHELRRNSDLAWQFGANQVDSFPQIAIDAEACEEANEWISRWQNMARSAQAHGLIGIVAAGSMSNFAWPAEKWQKALAQIWNISRLLPVMLSDGIELNPQIPSAKLNKPVSVLALAAILREMNAVISLDTGPAHIAAAMRVPTVVLSNGGHPGRFFPWPDAGWMKALLQPMACAGCVCRCPLAEPECLTGIEVADVVGALEQLRATPARRAA